MPELGQIAYEAYCQAIGITKPKWDALDIGFKGAWHAAAVAIKNGVMRGNTVAVDPAVKEGQH